MGMENAPAELYQEFMQDISAEIDREGKIIDDLLTLVKMDKSSPDLNIAQTSINGLLEQILKRLTPIAKRRNIEITYESKREVSADVDEVKLSLALSNLVENAIKYNREEGKVWVTLDADHKFFYVKVEDNGVGIPKEFQERVFERFYKLITVIRLYWTMETAHTSMIRKERNIWISQQDMQYLLWDITTRNLMMH